MAPTEKGGEEQEGMRDQKQRFIDSVLICVCAALGYVETDTTNIILFQFRKKRPAQLTFSR